MGLLEILLERSKVHLTLEPNFPYLADIGFIGTEFVRLWEIPCNFHYLTGEVDQVDRGLSGLGGLAVGLAGHCCSPRVLGY